MNIEIVSRKAERFDYRKISEQIKHLIEALSQQREIKREKYSQISDRTFEFLTRAFKNIPENEKEIVLFYILTTPSPKEQDKILNSISFLFEDPKSFKIKDIETLEKEKNDLIKNLLLQETLEGAIRDGQWFDLLKFFQNPENQKKYPDIFQETLEVLRRDGQWLDLLKFFQNSENQSKIQECFINIEKSLLSISDRNLREKYLSQIIEYLLSNGPLTLISLSRTEDLPLLITGKNLDIDPFVIQSWNLSEKEKESLLPIFVSLVNKGIKFDFPFPYHPRKELKVTRKHNEMLILYFRILNFISSLPEEISNVDLIQNHFKNIKKIIQDYNIKQSTLEISYRFLREILIEIKKLEEEVIKRIKKFLEIDPDINHKEIKNFIIKSPYSKIILTLVIHYLKIYKKGLTLLGKITSSLIKDPGLEDYFQMRYDLNDIITLKQLNPLLEGRSSEEYPQMIEK